MKKLILIAVIVFPLFAYAQEAPVKQIRRAAHERVYNDTTRLAALLRDAQSNINYSEAVWKAISNEANSLANRVYAARSETMRRTPRRKTSARMSARCARRR